MIEVSRLSTWIMLKIPFLGKPISWFNRRLRLLHLRQKTLQTLKRILYSSNLLLELLSSQIEMGSLGCGPQHCKF